MHQAHKRGDNPSGQKKGVKFILIVGEVTEQPGNLYEQRKLATACLRGSQAL